MRVPDNYKSNLAYDLSRFDVEEKRERRVVKEKEKFKLIKNSKARSGSVATGIFVAFTIGAVLFSMLYGKVSVSEWSAKVVDQSNTLAIAQSENARLQNELYSRVTLSYIEEYATSVLGLSKVSRSQVEYLNINTEELIEVNTDENKGNIFIAIKNWFGDVMEYLGF